MAGAADSRVLIVGGSLAGLRAAETLRQAGFEGALTMLGAEEGAPYDRPPLSKQVLAGAWDTDRVLLRSVDDLTGKLRCDVRLGDGAVALDLARRVVTTSAGAELGFDGLVIATGARPRRLPGTQHDPTVHVLRTLDDAVRLRAAFERAGSASGAGATGRVVVVGAGFIGAEVAATAHRRGLHVTVVEALPVPYERQLGREMGQVCAGLHARNGVTLRTGTGVSSIGGGVVALSDGSELPADVVVVGIGVVPNTEWLAGSPVAVGDGVLCDAACRVLADDGSVLHAVVAAGDVARWPNQLFPGHPDATEPESMRVEHWTNAAEMAAHAADSLFAELDGDDGRGSAFTPVPYFWSDQYDAKIQFLGRSTACDEVRVVDGSVEEGRLLSLYRRGDRLVGALGITKMRQLAGYRRLLLDRASWDDALAHAGA